MRPRLLITQEPLPGLRSVDDLRSAITYGHGKMLWDKLLYRVDNLHNTPPLVPTDEMPGRDPLMAKHANADYVIVQAAADRVTDAALVALITGQTVYRDIALEQMEALFDETRWPEWRDLAHHHVAADLRTGQLSQALGLAYDWLYTDLTTSQRHWIVEGIDRCGIQRYLQAVEENASYLTKQSNWQTCVVGGLGIAGMALMGDHPDAQRLIDLAHKRMLAYRSVYGPDGEFNENVGYAGATRLPVIYFSVHRYYIQGGENILAQHPFPETSLWYMYFTSPPNRTADFGDTHADATPSTSYYAAIAAATQNGLYQWYYQTFPERPNTVNLPLELLWYDDTVKPTEPTDQLPKGRAFPAHSGCISSRSSWHSDTPTTVVFSKAGHGSEGHGHHDAGQVCIDGFGERLIVDLCSPPMYPADFFGEHRYQYYNAGVFGHNVLMFDKQEMAVGKKRQATILDASFENKKGGCWSFDLTDCYDNVKYVQRTVIHLLPNIIVVLDQAKCLQAMDISLRWHTVVSTEPNTDGAFAFVSNGVNLSAQIVNLDTSVLSFYQRKHAYKAPYNKGRLGDVFENRHENYVEALHHSNQCNMMTLFAVSKTHEATPIWLPEKNSWRIHTSDTQAQVNLSNDKLTVKDESSNIFWEIDLEG